MTPSPHAEESPRPPATRTFDERAHAGAEHFDAPYVARYDAKAKFDALSELEALRQAGLGKDSTLLELGAGTGVLSRAAARLCRHVIAVDISDAMVEHLKQRVQADAIANVAVKEGGFLTYRHDGPPADFVYTRNALHHLPDLWKALALVRIASMLKEGGVLRLLDIIFSCDPTDMKVVVERWLNGAGDTSGCGWTRPELEAHLNQEHSTYSWLLEPMLTRAGFIIQNATYSESQIYAAYTCVKTRVDAGC